jgi:hypothetical protein
MRVARHFYILDDSIAKSLQISRCVCNGLSEQGQFEMPRRERKQICFYAGRAGVGHAAIHNTGLGFANLVYTIPGLCDPWQFLKVLQTRHGLSDHGQFGMLARSRRVIQLHVPEKHNTHPVHQIADYKSDT